MTTTQHGTLWSGMSDRATRADLAALPTPERMGRFHRPIAHIDLIESLEGVLIDHDLEIAEEAFAVQRGGLRLFGIMELRSGNGLGAFARGDMGFALGLRSGNDQTMAVRLAAGSRVFVCDNMAFAGDDIVLCRKHTTNVSLMDELHGGISRYVQAQRGWVELTDRARQRQVIDSQARSIIYDAFVRDRLLPTRLIHGVHRAYFEPESDWTDITDHPRSAWALHNAFTRAARELGPHRRFNTTHELGRRLEEWVN